MIRLSYSASHVAYITDVSWVTSDGRHMHISFVTDDLIIAEQQLHKVLKKATRLKTLTRNQQYKMLRNKGIPIKFVPRPIPLKHELMNKRGYQMMNTGVLCLP